mmetsp:Transcript_8671/g.28930  ORF Transcript_8671/g.28930 Transcript_8671/m.28930 type:complete len:85 (-) Transcript_8671:126-380(-)
MVAPMLTAEWYSLSPMAMAFWEGKRPKDCRETSQVSHLADFDTCNRVQQGEGEDIEILVLHVLAYNDIPHIYRGIRDLKNRWRI